MEWVLIIHNKLQAYKDTSCIYKLQQLGIQSYFYSIIINKNN